MDKNWAECVTKRVYEAWNGKYAGLCTSGFKVFYSPIKENPTIMIIGYNPGGAEKDFKEDREKFEKGDFSVPTEQEYIEKEYPIAKKMRKLFEGKEPLDVLEKSVKINLIFFRSKDIRKWKKSIEKSKRKEMENFCFPIVKESINKVRPKMLLIEGFGTYRKLKKNILGTLSDEKSIESNGRRLCCSATWHASWNNVKVFSVLHPIGSRISNEEWKEIKRAFHNNLELLSNQRL